MKQARASIKNFAIPPTNIQMEAGQPEPSKSETVLPRLIHSSFVYLKYSRKRKIERRYTNMVKRFAFRKSVDTIQAVRNVPTKTYETYICQQENGQGCLNCDLPKKFIGKRATITITWR